MELWIVALLLGLSAVGGGAWIATRRRRARDEEIAGWAAREGWGVDSTDPGNRFRTHLFSTRRRGGRCRNVYRHRVDGTELLLFEYGFLENAGNTTRRVRQTVLATRRDDGPEERWTAFELRPEKLVDKLAARLGRDDIDFEHRPDFSRRYLLRGEDEPAVRRLFDSTRMRFFERNQGWSVECDGEWLITYRARREVAAAELDAFVREGLAIRKLLMPPRR